jgi:APA family basic amino acid/polyamine antiporter
MTGIVPYKDLGVADPVALVLNTLKMPVASALVSVGAIAGITSVLLVLIMGQPRILFAMSRDGLLPRALSRVHPRHKTPHVTTWLTGGIVAVAAALTPINVSAELCSIGTLFAYIIVAAGVIVLRYTRPDIPRAFKAPLSPVLPALGILLCAYLMLSLPLVTWYRFLVWLALGLIIYISYGSRKSLLNTGGGTPPTQASTPDRQPSLGA